MSERWLPVVGYEGLYEVSDGGRVRSLARQKWNGRIFYMQPSRILANKPNAVWGYVYVNLCAGRKVTSLRVHRLVLEAFVGPCPDGMEACHNNGNRADNVLTNLRWDTRESNHADKRRHGTSRIGKKMPWLEPWSFKRKVA